MFLESEKKKHSWKSYTEKFTFRKKSMAKSPTTIINIGRKQNCLLIIVLRNWEI